MTITETEFNAATREPRNTEIPACFTLPADLAQAIAERERAYDAWVEVEDAATAAWLAVDQAKRDDQRALVDAVAAGKGDPGTEATAKAERALVVALERVRQARVKADTADGEVARLYKAHMGEFVSQAVAHARARMEAYDAKLAQAKALMAEAANEFRDASVGLREVREHVAPRMLYTAPSRVPEVNWNDNDRLDVFGHLSNLCDNIEATTAPAAA